MEASMALYDATAVPAIRAPLPDGVSGVRFVSDFRGVPIVDLASWSSRLSSAEADVLP
jgi:hypothetical protein